MKLVKRIGAESNCGPLFQTLTRLPNVLLWIIMKIKFSIEKWWCTDIKDWAGRLGATLGPRESLWTNKPNARGILAGACWHLSTKFLIWLSKMQYFHFRSLIFAVIMNKIIMNKINPWTYKFCLSFFLPKFSVAVHSSLAHILRQLQWWSDAMVARYDCHNLQVVKPFLGENTCF